MQDVGSSSRVWLDPIVFFLLPVETLNHHDNAVTLPATVACRPRVGWGWVRRSMIESNGIKSCACSKTTVEKPSVRQEDEIPLLLASC